MARTLKMSKNTVKEYLAKIGQGGYKAEDLLAMEDPELERKLHAGNPAYSDQRFGWLKEQLDYYASELKRKGVTRKLLWEEYNQAQQQGYQYTQFCYHLNQHLRSAKPTMVLDHQPGDKLYIDFAGKTARYTDPAKRRADRMSAFCSLPTVLGLRLRHGSSQPEDRGLPLCPGSVPGVAGRSSRSAGAGQPKKRCDKGLPL
jgi:hypothetical protein